VLRPDDSSTSSSEPAGRWIARLALPWIAVLLAFGAALHAHRAWLNESGMGDFQVEHATLPRLARWAEARSAASGTPVVLFGDSLSLCADPGKRGQDRVGRALRGALERAHAPIDLLDLAHPGLRPIHYYALLGEALDERPDAVVVEINVRAFLPDEALPGRARLPHLLRKIGLRDAVRLRGPLAADQLSVLDPALFQLKDDLGLLYALEGLRESFLDWLRSVSQAATEAVGLRHVRSTKMAEFARRTRPPGEIDYTAHPNAAVLRAILEATRARGAHVLFYVAPVNPNVLAAAGPEVARNLPDRIEALRHAVGATHDEWLDLHDRLPASLFRDAHGHLRRVGCTRVATPLAERLLRVLHS
jgi:hypothetical protein